MARRLLICLFVTCLFSAVFIKAALSSEFDELDKPPEGAHEGQMFLGAFFSFGWPQSELINAEDKFVQGSYYTFENGISKEMQLSHQCYVLGASFEYMPLDHLGAGISLRRTYLVQSTAFGSEYENWKGYLYRDIALYINPAFHATSRKSWDFVLSPKIGYSIAKYNATPVAKKILEKYAVGSTPAEKYRGDTARESKGFSYGAELNCTLYFTGGLYVSIGGEWIRNTLKFDKGFDLTNPQTDAVYTGKTSATLDTYSVIIKAGYAFSN
ncbi:MAG: hypothetical protein V1874_04695 [Spirochaetota bacterium]